MPTFRNRTILEMAQGIRAFLTLEVGLTRDVVANFEQRFNETRIKNKNRHLKRMRRQVSNSSDQNLKQVHQEPVSKDGEPTELQTKLAERSTSAEASGLRPENIVWIFGFGRSGSTWLKSMMTELENHQLWEEPLVGWLFGNFYDTWCTGDPRGNREDFVFGGQREVWLNSIRSFVLERIKAQFSEIGNDILVVKEPNGSIGAPLLMEALPDSRMILLVRDPRDVMASFIDAQRQRGWGREFVGENKLPKEFDAKRWCRIYIKHLNNAKQAYEAHKGHKILVKYEQLLADPLCTMKRIYSALRLALCEEELIKAVEKHSWENIPEGLKGEGKFYRKATPGGWKEDLSAEQIEIVEKIAGPILEEFYSQG